MSSERDSFAKGIFSTFAKGFLLHKVLLEVNFSPLRVKKSRSHDMGQYLLPKKSVYSWKILLLFLHLLILNSRLGSSGSETQKMAIFKRKILAK
jgi:hypothetical protein